MELRLRPSAVPHLQNIARCAAKFSPDIILQCTPAGFTIVAINPPLTAFVHARLSADALISAPIINDPSIIMRGFRLSVANLLTALDCDRAEAVTIVFTDVVVTFVHVIAQLRINHCIKLDYEPLNKVVQAVHPPLDFENFFARFTSLAAPWIACLSKVVGTPDELCIETAQGLLVLETNSSRATGTSCRLGLPIAELYDFQLSRPVRFIVSLPEFRAILSLAKAEHALLAFWARGPGVPAVVTMATGGNAKCWEECKFILATVAEDDYRSTVQIWIIC